MAYSDHPFIEAEGNNYYTYSTQGNNGKLTVTPATAIKLTKTLGEASPISEESFTFTITGDVSTAVVVRLAADGTETGREALLAGGKVRLAAGESVYIVGLRAGNYTVSEDEHDTFKVSSVIVGGVPQLATDAQIALSESSIADVHFVNVERGYGNLIITKELSHAQGHALPSSALSEKFTVNVDFGADLKNKSFDWRIGSRTGSVMLDGAGCASFELAHAESVIILNIPEDTVVTVDEVCASPYSFVKINTRDHTGAVQDSAATPRQYSTTSISPSRSTTSSATRSQRISLLTEAFRARQTLTLSFSITTSPSPLRAG